MSRGFCLTHATLNVYPQDRGDLLKLKQGLVYRQIAGKHIVIPTGDNIADFNGIINLNETAAFLWQKLRDGGSEDQLIAALQDEFEVDALQARQGVAAFLQDMRELNAIVED